MTAVNREYRVRVATQGADDVEGNVDFTLDLQDLAEPPVVTGHIPHVLAGATEMRPFNVLVIDHAGTFTDAMTDNGRWVMLGRLLDVGYRDLPSGIWVTYGTGRISAADESDGPGRYRLEVSDESWVGRKARIFDVANTTRLWPAGRNAPWRGFGAPNVGTGTLVTSSGNKHRIVVEGRSPNASVGGIGAEILPALLKWADSDTVADPLTGSGATANFTHLRLNYAGASYQIVGFGKHLTADILDGLKNPDVESADNANRRIRFSVWVLQFVGTPPASGAAYLEAPTAPLGGGMVLHLGIADDAHEFGSVDGWLHPAELTERYFLATGQRHNSDSIAASLADTSVPLLAPRVTERPDDPEKWMQDHVWGPSLHIVLRDTTGRRKLVNMRLPQDINPDSLTTIDASNADRVTWRLSGREAVNSITWRYAHHSTGNGDARDAGNIGSHDLDGLIVDEREADPIEGDTIYEIGRRPLALSLLGALEPSANIGRSDERRWSGRGAMFADATAAASRELLDIFQDGAFTFVGEVSSEISESLEEGELVLLDLDSLQQPNPASGARSDLRLVRVMHIAKHPAFGEIEVLDLGPAAQPLTAPSVSIEQDGSDADVVDVTIGGVPAGATAVVEVGFSDTTTPPTSWIYSRVDLADGVHSFRGLPGVGFVHARAKSVAPQRIRSAWASDNVELADTPLLRDIRVEIGAAGVPTVFGDWNAATAGARISFDVFALEDDPGAPADATDHDVTDLTAGIALATAVGAGQGILVRSEPWTGFVDPDVTGTAGAAVDVIERVPAASTADPNAATIDLLDIEEINTGEGKFTQVTVLLGSKTASWAAYESRGASWPTTDGLVDGPLDETKLIKRFPATVTTYRNSVPGDVTVRVLAVPYNELGREGERESDSVLIGGGGGGTEEAALIDTRYARESNQIVLYWDINDSITSGDYDIQITRGEFGDDTVLETNYDPFALSYTDPELVTTPKGTGIYREFIYKLALRDIAADTVIKNYNVLVSGWFLLL